MTKKYAVPANVHIFEKIYRFCEPFGTVYAAYAENETEDCRRNLAMIKLHHSAHEYYLYIVICGDAVTILDMVLDPRSVGMDDFDNLRRDHSEGNSSESN